MTFQWLGIRIFFKVNRVTWGCSSVLGTKTASLLLSPFRYPRLIVKSHNALLMKNGLWHDTVRCKLCEQIGGVPFFQLVILVAMDLRDSLLTVHTAAAHKWCGSISTWCTHTTHAVNCINYIEEGGIWLTCLYVACVTRQAKKRVHADLCLLDTLSLITSLFFQ